MKREICTDTSHGGSSYLNRAFVCGRYGCGGIQAWRHHFEENARNLLSDEHRWQKHFGLPLTPVPNGVSAREYRP